MKLTLSLLIFNLKVNLDEEASTGLDENRLNAISSDKHRAYENDRLEKRIKDGKNLNKFKTDRPEGYQKRRKNGHKNKKSQINTMSSKVNMYNNQRPNSYQSSSYNNRQNGYNKPKHNYRSKQNYNNKKRNNYNGSK